MKNSTEQSTAWDLGDRIELGEELYTARLGTMSDYTLDADLGNENGKEFGLTTRKLEAAGHLDEHEALALYCDAMDRLLGPIEDMPQ